MVLNCIQLPRRYSCGEVALRQYSTPRSAKRAKSNKSPLTPNKKSTLAALNFFVREIYVFFRLTFYMTGPVGCREEKCSLRTTL